MRAGLEGSSTGSFVPAVEIEGRRLCDGGVVANVPVLQALDLGAAALVVLDCRGAIVPQWGSIAEILLYANSMTQNRRRAAEIPAAAERVPVVYLPLPAVTRSTSAALPRSLRQPMPPGPRETVGDYRPVGLATHM